jgi:hypothetical protein
MPRVSGKTITQSTAKASGGKAGGVRTVGATALQGLKGEGSRGGSVRVFGKGFKEPISTRSSARNGAVPSDHASRTAPIPK